jgi:hypothetical protein
LEHQASTSSETEILQKQKKAERNTAKTKKRQNTLNKIQIKTSSFHIVRNRNTAKTNEGSRKYCKNKRRQNKLKKK